MGLDEFGEDVIQELVRETVRVWGEREQDIVAFFGMSDTVTVQCSASAVVGTTK